MNGNGCKLEVLGSLVLFRRPKRIHKCMTGMVR